MTAEWFVLSLSLIAGADGGVSKSEAITPEERSAFDARKARVGADADALAQLALWAESKGLASERDSLLKRAVEAAPAYPLARGLLGQVSVGGAWKSPAEVASDAKPDERTAASLADYDARRERLIAAEAAEREKIARLEAQGRVDEARAVRSQMGARLAQGHLKLGQACESAGLKDEASAYFSSAVFHDPYLDLAWKHLGYVNRNGRWMTRDQIAADQKETAAQRSADRRWGPLLHLWKGWLKSDVRKADAERNLDGVDDPRAVPSIVKEFETASEDDQARAVVMLGRLDSPASTRELSTLAVRSDFAGVRRNAAEFLKKREPRDYAETLVRMIRKPWTYKVAPVQGVGSSGTLEVDSPRFHLIRTYDAPPAFQLGENFFGYVGIDPNGLPLVISGRDLDKYRRGGKTAESILLDDERKTAEMIAEAQLKAEWARQAMVGDIVAIERANAEAAASNPRIVETLRVALDAPAELGDDEDSWNRWYYDKAGYSYTPPAKAELRNRLFQAYPPSIRSCFAAGTPVRTVAGPRPIETLKVGDKVLAQDTTTGALSFQPIVVVHHNPPDATLQVALDDGDILVASRFHRFWLAGGKGWAMARDLKAGDVVRTLGATSTVKWVEPGPFVPVFNLDVAKARTFFVGERDALVHDNTPPDPKARAFDPVGPLDAPGAKP